MDETEVYKKQEMGRPISLGVRPALLVIDFVNGFFKLANDPSASEFVSRDELGKMEW